MLIMEGKVNDHFFISVCFISYSQISGSPLLLVFSLSKGEHANRGLRFVYNLLISFI
jgi:hypothetical protein